MEAGQKGSMKLLLFLSVEFFDQDNYRFE